MQKTVLDRITEAAAAYQKGAFAGHAIVETAEKSDDSLSNSWGPAMRR